MLFAFLISIKSGNLSYLSFKFKYFLKAEIIIVIQ